MALRPITEQELDEYAKLEAERKEHQRQADAIEKRTKPLKAHFLAYLQTKGAKQVKRGPYDVRLVEKPGRVSWKEVVVEKLGALFAGKLANEAPPIISIEVTKS